MNNLRTDLDIDNPLEWLWVYIGHYQEGLLSQQSANAYIGNMFNQRALK